MAVINQINNQANIIFNGNPIVSEFVGTLLQLPPTIIKAVDKAVANINDILTYTITITNTSLVELANIVFNDNLAVGGQYVTNSFKVNTVAATPTLTNNLLSYTIPTIAVLTPTIITFQVKVIGGVY